MSGIIILWYLKYLISEVDIRFLIPVLHGRQLRWCLVARVRARFLNIMIFVNRASLIHVNSISSEFPLMFIINSCSWCFKFSLEEPQINMNECYESTSKTSNDTLIHSINNRVTSYILRQVDQQIQKMEVNEHTAGQTKFISVAIHPFWWFGYSGLLGYHFDC
jgi:hypothetical protein